MKPKLSLNQVQKIMQINRALRTLPGFYGAQQSGVGGGLTRSWIDYGYPTALDFHFYHLMYSRVGLAGAVVDIKTDLCWLNRPTVKRGDKEDETFKEFSKRTKLWGSLKQLDKMQSVGHYAGAIVRVADGKELREPLNMDSIALDDIESFTPAWESQLIVGTLDSNPKSPRYGLPVTYTYNQRVDIKTNQRDGGESVTVHHSRVIIMNEGAAGNTIYGRSDLERPYNSIISWASIIGAGGEGFKRMASARHVLQQLANGEQYSMPSEDQLDAITEALEDMQQDPFSAVPYLGGMELKSIQATLSDPKGFSEITLNDVSASCGFSAKGLIGAQEGRLAGSQDSDSDKQRAQSRCDNFLIDFLQDFAMWLEDKCKDFTTDDLEFEFPDLMAPSDASKLENAHKMAQINKELVASGMIAFEVSEIRKAAGFESDADVDDMDDLATEAVEEEPELPNVPAAQ